MTSSNKTPGVAEELLQGQIEKYSNFDRELVAGAGAKAIMAGLKAKSRDLWQLKPHDIVVIDGFNPRTQNAMYFAGVEALAENMVAHGYMQDKPLSVYIAKIDGQDVVALNDGHRRLAAVKRAVELGAKIETIPVVAKDRSHNMVDLTLSLLHSNEGEPFNTYEKAVIAKRLKGYGWDNAKIAKEMRCTPAFVGQLLMMAGAPEAIKKLVESGQMSVTHAIDLVKEHGENAASVAQASAAKAKGKGKGRTTAKDVVDPKVRKAKKLGWELYTVADRLFRMTKVVEAMPRTVYEELDRLMTAVEKAGEVKPKKEPKPPKAPKAPKPIKVKAAKKTPLAKKVAGAKKPTQKKLAPWDQAKGEQRPTARGTSRRPPVYREM